jgi:DNA-binding SARP family transcriptional activator
LKLRKAEALLAYLAVSPGQSAARETLAALLWGDFEQSRARQSLRQVLSALGRALSGCRPPPLCVRSQSISLVPGAVSVDVQELERLVAEGTARSLAAAAALYRGEFLEGLRLEAPEFEDWLLATRSRLRDLALKALTAHLGQCEDAEEIGAAAATAREILALEPFREDIHRRLMRLYLRRGMRASALAQYHECREVLARELGVPPDEETTRLYRLVVDQQDGPAAHNRPAPRRLAAAPGRPTAEMVERLRAEALETHYRALAARLGERGRPGEALATLLEAGQLEMRRGSPLTSRRILEPATALLATPADRADGWPQTLDLLLLRAAATEAEDDLEAALAALAAALPLAEARAQSARRAQVLIAQSRIRRRQAEDEAAWDDARRGLALAERAGGAGVWLDSERLLAQRHLIAGPLRALAEPLVGRAGRAADLGLTADEAKALAVLGLVRAMAGEFAEARDDCLRAVALAGDTRLPDCQVAALEAQGLVRLWCAEAGPALESFGRALEIAEGRGDLLRGYALSGFRGLALLAGGRRSAARRELDRAVTMARRLETRFLLPFVKAWQAEAASGSGASAGLPGFSREVLSLAAQTNQPWAGSIASRALAVALSRPRSRDLGRAERAINAAVATQRGLDLRFELARSLLVQADILDARGKSAQSGRAVAEADALFRQMGRPPRAQPIEPPAEGPEGSPRPAF